jgi:AcrR family transcriptional regulator
MSSGAESDGQRTGAGPIWTRPAPGRRRPRYTREQIAEAALRIADAEGYDAVSMRRVAADLGAGTMTLYHYVRTKDELRALMDDAIMAELLIPADELSADWREAVAQIARRSRAAFRRHPWTLTRHDDSQGQGGPNGMRHFEQSLAAVASTGLDATGRVELIAMVDDYVYGFAMREAAVADGGSLDDIPDALFDYLDRQLATGEYPHIAALVGDDIRVGFLPILAAIFDEDRFERGLQRLLDGIEVELSRRAPAKRRRGR